MNFKKIFIILFVFSIIFSNVKAQDFEFMHGAGLTLSFLTTDVESTSYPAFTYHPRINFLNIGTDATLSFGANVSGFLAFSTDPNASSNNGLVFEFAPSVDYNFGFGSSEYSRADFGGFGGIGWAYNSASFSNNFGGEDHSSASGLMLNGGGRFVIREKPISASLYTILSKNVNVFLGLRVLYIFGL